MADTPVQEATLTLTERAAARLREIVADDPSRPVLKVGVEGGGCSGFQYKMDLVAAPEADDTLTERDGAVVAVDAVSLVYLAGSEIDFVDDLIGATFRINNPQATAACGCGTSFSI